MPTNMRITLNAYYASRRDINKINEILLHLYNGCNDKLYGRLCVSVHVEAFYDRERERESDKVDKNDLKE